MQLELLIASLLFWPLTLGVILLRPQRALLCYLLITQIDLAGFSDPGQSSMVANFVKVLILPVVLVIRTGVTPVSLRDWARTSRIWLYFVAYASVAVLWAPDKTAAIKMVAYLLSYVFLYPVFQNAWKKGWLTYRTLLTIVWIELAIAVFQTYPTAGLFSTTEERFTSFCAPQDFAAFLVCVLCLLLFSDVPRRTLVVNTGAIVVGILMSGSRYCFIGMACIFLIAGIARARKGGALVRPFAVVKGLALAVAIISVVALGVVKYAPDNRLNQLAESYAQGSIDNVGTLVERLGIYRTALLQISDRVNDNLPQLVFGSGTSSSANVFSEFHSLVFEYYQDANRCLHDEFLRSMYEWGILGLLLLVSFLGITAFHYAKLARSEASTPAWVVSAIMPTLLLGLLVENVLVEATSGAGTGYLLILTYGSAFTGASAGASPVFSVEDHG